MTLRELMNKVETFNKLGEELGNTGRAYVDAYADGKFYSGKTEKQMIDYLRREYDEENVNRIMDCDGYTVDCQEVLILLNFGGHSQTILADAQVVNYDVDYGR